MPKTKQKLLRYPPGIEEKVKKLKERFSYPSDAVVFIQGINIFYEQTFENYKEVAKFKAINKPSPVDKARAAADVKDEREKIEKERHHEKKLAICNLLGGEIIEENGHFACTYLKYQEAGGAERYVETMPMTTPFDMLADDTPQYQYADLMGRQGDFAKKKIEKLIKEGKLKS
jgi:hypothetical protein